MKIHSTVAAIVALLPLWLSQAAFAQAPMVATAAGAKQVTEADLKNLLVWNSPWEGRATAPGRAYSYRTVFHVRRDAVVAEVISYATNQRADSVVDFRDGQLNWQDSNGADVTVALADGGNLVGTAMHQNTTVPIVLKPRP
jgi:hypothetical protein